MRSRTAGITLVVSSIACSFALAGCGSSAPTQRPTSPSAVAAPTAPSPTVTSLSVTAGSIGGGTPLRIVGTGLFTGATVSFAGSKVATRTDHRFPGTDLFLDTPAHDSGTVDIIVTNPDGQTVRVANGYTYVQADELDFNGTWNGFGHDGQDIPLGFVIRNNALVSAYCDEFTTLTFSPPVLVSGGAFSSFGADGRGIEGRIVSAKDAVGTSNIPPCNRGSIWGAEKQAPRK